MGEAAEKLIHQLPQYIAEPTPELFHRDPAFVRAIRGPVGSSKTSACIMEVFARAAQQNVFNGVRRSRWGVFRNTYPELKSTTIKSWEEWYPSELGLGRIRYDYPINTTIRYDMKDGTKVENEIIFMALDKPRDIEKITSLQLTGAYIHEARDFPKAALDMITGRVQRYPPKRMGGFNWSGIIMDYNAPDEDHWLYYLAEVVKPKNMSFYRQPPAMFKEGDSYLPNTGQRRGIPAAENVNNLPAGWNYYFNLIEGKSEDWIKVYVLNEYGFVMEGKPVYPEYNDLIHCSKKPLEIYRGLPLILGFDCGLTPACTISQILPNGQWRLLDEVCADYMAMRQFCQQRVIPHLASNYSGIPHSEFVDMSGNTPDQGAGSSAIKEMKAQGFSPVPSWTNDYQTRRDALANYFIGMIPTGEPLFILDPKAKKTRKGLKGAYQYSRVQVIGEERYRDEPKKNEYSHPVESVQYAALGARGRAAPARARAREEVRVSTRAWS